MCPMCENCDYKDEKKQKECEDARAECEEKKKECAYEQFQLLKRNEFYVFWNTTVSDNCCLYCNNTVYKADTVIDTTKLEDKCESEETHVCRKIPGILYDTIVRYHFQLLHPKVWRRLRSRRSSDTEFVAMMTRGSSL